MLKFCHKDPRKLIPYSSNARMHPRKQIDQLKSSITEFGFTNPILVDEVGVVIAGHGRLTAALELAFDTVPVIEISSLQPAQIKALRLSDNKIALNSGWDVDLRS